MGGKSKSSNSTSTTNISGQSGISGDNLGVSAAGVNGDLSVTMSDYGAMSIASDMAGNVSKTIDGVMGLGSDALGFGSDALKSNEHAIEESLKMVTDNIGAALDASTKTQVAASKMAENTFSEALGAVGDSQKRAFSFGQDAIASNEKTSRDAIAANRAILEDSIDFGSDVLASNAKTAQHAVEEMRKNAADTVDLAGDLSAQSAMTTKEVIRLSEGMNATAEKVASQSQTGSSDSMARVAMVSAVAFAIAMAVKG